MIKSKHNIVSKILESDQYFAINLLSGNADLLSEEEANALISTGELQNADKGLMQDMTEKGYLVSPEGEKKIYRNKYFDFIDQRDDEEVGGVQPFEQRV